MSTPADEYDDPDAFDPCDARAETRSEAYGQTEDFEAYLAQDNAQDF